MLSTNGVDIQKVRLKHNGNCEGIANAWVDVNMKGINMQKTINKYQSRFDGLMKSIEKDKILKKMPGNATAGIAVQMIKDLKNYLKVNKA